MLGKYVPETWSLSSPMSTNARVRLHRPSRSYRGYSSTHEVLPARRQLNHGSCPSKTICLDRGGMVNQCVITFAIKLACLAAHATLRWGEREEGPAPFSVAKTVLTFPSFARAH